MSSDSEIDDMDFANLDSSDSCASKLDPEVTLSDDDDDNDSNDDVLLAARQWYQLPVGDNLAPAPPPLPFVGNPGILIDVGISEMTPLDFFPLYFDDDLVDFVYSETNRFAQQTSPRGKNWHPVTVREMHLFFAVNILGGIIKAPDLEMHWSKHPLF
uniref:PiggyBac transposable element-derived protein domain-containing protein n=1 Tax=Octopus bimaculoides TaxID=37653 RepID=A0A0L8G3C7_OCTBM